MKLQKIILIGYCILIGATSTLDIIAQPDHQPLKNILTAIVMIIILIGVFKKIKILLFSIVFLILFMFLEHANSNNASASLALIIGSLLPLGLVYWNYINLEKELKLENNSIPKQNITIECNSCGQKNKLTKLPQKGTVAICGKCKCDLILN